MGEVAQREDQLGLVDPEPHVALGEVEDPEVDPLDAPEVVAERLPKLAVGVDRLAVDPVDDEPHEGHGAVGVVADHVQVHPVDVEPVGGDHVRAALRVVRVRALAIPTVIRDWVWSAFSCSISTSPESLPLASR